MRFGATAFLATVTLAALSGPALAGPEPYYGYSPYFGGPATYYTHDQDVRETSVQSHGLPGFGTRTYTRGGPFWARKDVSQRLTRDRRHERRRVLRSRG